MVLINCRRDFVNLQDRCRAEIMRRIKKRDDLAELKLPIPIIKYLSEVFNDSTPLTPVDNIDMV